MLRNVTAARRVLDPAGWNAGHLHGRALTPDDIDELVVLGERDADFAWERAIQRRKYYEGLLQFRLGHYWLHGFGVHGVLLDGRLVGQCGLQVLDAERDRVEIVVFLGRDYVGQGFGSVLVRYVLQRCAAERVSEVFGVVRDDNEAGLALMRRFGAVPIERKVHFGYEATVLRLSIPREE